MYDIYVMDADGTDARSISRPGDTDGHPVWSPGGELVAYATDAGPVQRGELRIVIVDADSGERVTELPTPGMDLYPIDWRAE